MRLARPARVEGILIRSSTRARRVVSGTDIIILHLNAGKVKYHSKGGFTVGPKKTQIPDDWKQIRVRRGWLELIREAHKANPSFSPTCDLATTSEPNIVNVACQIASTMISGLFWEKLTPDIDRIVDRVRADTAVSVALHLGATIRKNPDGTLTITKPGMDDATLPQAEPVQRATFIH